MPSITYSRGLWNETESGFFSLDSRLASVQQEAGLTLPLAPRPVWMPEHPIVNATVMGLIAFQEAYVREEFLRIFRTSCSRHGKGRSGLFVDSGSNEGTWSMLAAAHGCDVVAVDPQPLCINLLRAGARRSGFLSIELHNNVVAPLESHNGSMSVPIDQCHGTSEYNAHERKVSDVTRDGRNNLGTYKARHATRLPVLPASMDDLIGPTRTISLWHVDVEGAEVPVLLSARRLFAERRVRRVMFEFIPSRWPAQKVSFSRGLFELDALFRGWSCHVVCPSHPEHHLKRLHFTPALVHEHMLIAGRTTCENAFCVDQLVQARPDAV